MSTTVDTSAASATEPSPGAGALQKGALGPVQVLFLIVTGAAPLAAMVFNVPVTVLGAGYAAPAAFLIATVVLTIFSVGYIEMSRRVSSIGGFYTFITRGLGAIPGLGSGILIGLCYIIFAAGVLGAFGYFASTAIESWTGFGMSGWIYSFIALAIMSTFAFFDIELTAKVLGVALIGEILVLSILAVAVVSSGGGPDGIVLDSLNPTALFDNSSAVQVFGAAAVGIALFGAFWSWVGFEMAPNYAEESRDPKRIAKVATYGSVIGLGLFYMLMSVIFVSAWGKVGAAEGVAAQFAGESDSAWYPIAESFAGGWLVTMFQFLMITSSFACAMAFFNTGARYIFSLSREGLLPAAFAKTNPKHQSPANASMAVTVIVAVWIAAFTISYPSTLDSLVKLATWTPLLGVLGILGVQALCCLAIMRYFLTEAKDGFHWWKTFLAPLLGFGGQVGAMWLLVANRGGLGGAADAGFIKVFPWVALATFVIGMAYAVYLRSTAPTRYAHIGAFEADDPPIEEALHGVRAHAA
ncbi:MAG: APC family permease [Solirubrobacteraceae bacterium]|nr:APC family permease [Solirubrobacteraceae bacterium]